MTHKISSVGSVGVGTYDPKKKMSLPSKFPPSIKSMTVSEVANELHKRKGDPKKMPTTAPEAPKGSALIRPGDITDAVDSRDLLDTLLEKNLAKIAAKQDIRIVNKWLREEKSQMRERYNKKAREAYNKMWNSCGNKSVGHENRVLDIQGYSIHQCDICGFATPTTVVNSISSGRYEGELKKSNEMNNEMVKAMAERMIELDLEAGIFEWPTANDYPRIVKSTPVKKKGLFSR